MKIPALIVGLLAAAGAAEAMAIEEPRYEVLAEQEGWELRRYAPTLVAEVEVEADFEEAGSRAFRTLAGYIFGKNTRDEKIGMTAPVSQQAAGERIGMTAPVTQQAREGRHVIAFMMPARYTAETLPAPVDPRIVLRELPARLVAVRGYSGRWTAEGYQENEARLMTALDAAGLVPAGAPTWARFNSPYSLWFLRRNEVQVTLAEESPGLRPLLAAGPR
ncbi:MAG: heme-binding protein [Deltaproteobacteria bacterium]|nr:heme-binding protein [Deltaproteobacteria bacterium]